MMKAYLGFKRYHVRGIEKFRRGIRIVIMAMNMIKLTVQRRLRFLIQNKNADENENQERFRFHQRYFIFKGKLCRSLFFISNLKEIVSTHQTHSIFSTMICFSSSAVSEKSVKPARKAVELPAAMLFL